MARAGGRSTASRIPSRTRECSVRSTAVLRDACAPRRSGDWMKGARPETRVLQRVRQGPGRHHARWKGRGCRLLAESQRRRRLHDEPLLRGRAPCLGVCLQRSARDRPATELDTRCGERRASREDGRLPRRVPGVRSHERPPALARRPRAVCEEPLRHALSRSGHTPLRHGARHEESSSAEERVRTCSRSRSPRAIGSATSTVPTATRRATHWCAWIASSGVSSTS